MGGMNPKLGEIVIFDNSSDLPKGIRLISTFGKNMTYKHMPFCDTCYLLYISFFTICSYNGKNLYLSLMLLRDCSYYDEDWLLRRIKMENKSKKIIFIVSYAMASHFDWKMKIENVIFIVMGGMNPKLGKIIIINNSNDFPKGIRLISILSKNMTHKHMPFCEWCCLLYI